SVTGVIAQEAPVTTVKLTENTTDGLCSASVESESFGTFEWTGSAYTGTFTGSFTITANQTISPSNVDCDYTFTGSNLSAGGSDSILASEIQLESGLTGTPDLFAESPFTISVPSDGATHSIGYDLEQALHKQAPGDYEGTITVTTIG